MKFAWLLRPLPWAIGVWAAYWLALFVGTHLPQLPNVDAPVHSDKAAHFLGYAGLSFLAAVVLLRRNRWSLAGAGAILVGVMAYGVCDEVLQIPIPGRTADPWDWVFDSLGAVTGLVVFRLVQKGLALVREARLAREVAWEKT